MTMTWLIGPGQLRLLDLRVGVEPSKASATWTESCMPGARSIDWISSQEKCATAAHAAVRMCELTKPILRGGHEHAKGVWLDEHPKLDLPSTS
jgi:hypothetical protein